MKKEIRLVGSGGGIYAYGNLTISGSNTKIMGNTASTYGGGIMLKTTGTIEDGRISDNKTLQYAGGGVRVDGILVMNGGIITNNTANTNGGGVDYSPGSGLFLLNSGTIENNTATNIGNDTYPPISDESQDWTKDESLNLQRIDIELIKKYKRGSEIENATLQGMTMTDKYIIFAQMTSNTSNTYINIVDKDTMEILNTVSDYCFGHANALTYNPNEDKCYISYNANSKSYISSFRINDNYEFEDMENIEVSRYYFGIAYDIDDDYFIGVNGNTIYIMDSNFNEFYHFTAKTNLTRQDIAYYKNHIYFSCYEAGMSSIYQTNYNSREKCSNIIYMYNMEGKLEKTLYVPNTTVFGELEDVSIQKSGNLVLAYNTDNWSTISFYQTNYLKDINSIEVTTIPTKRTYIQDYEILDLTGGEITVSYNDVSTATLSLTDESIIKTGFDNTKIGANTITIEYGGETTTLTVEIVPKQVTKIELTKEPIKMTYIQNHETLNLAGGEITVTYDDTSVEKISLTNENIKCTGFDNTEVGTNAITIEYENQKITFDIEIIEKEENKGTDDENGDTNEENKITEEETKDTNDEIGDTNEENRITEEGTKDTNKENIEQQGNREDTLATNILPYTGTRCMIAILISGSLILSFIFYKKYKKYNNL